MGTFKEQSVRLHKFRESLWNTSHEKSPVGAGLTGLLPPDREGRLALQPLRGREFLIRAFQQIG